LWSGKDHYIRGGEPKKKIHLPPLKFEKRRTKGGEKGVWASMAETYRHEDRPENPKANLFKNSRRTRGRVRGTGSDGGAILGQGDSSEVNFGIQGGA